MKLGLFGLFAAGAAAAVAAGCTVPEAEPDPAANPNAGLLRDFLDGKFDAAGHPLNAKVIEAETVCGSAGSVRDGAIRLSRACTAAIAGPQQHGQMVASLRVKVTSNLTSGPLVRAELLVPSQPNYPVVSTAELSVEQLRGNGWADLPVEWFSDGSPVTIRITPLRGAVVDFDYAELFLERFGLVASPGSGLVGDDDTLVFEMPPARALDEIKLDGVDITDRLKSLLQQGKATRTMTTFRTIVEVAVGDLAPERKATSELEMHAVSQAARVQLRREPQPCRYEGDPDGVKVLITGFQPFPADGWHDNVSGVAVTSLDAAQLRGAQVMRVVMPVEYDRAAAQVTELIERCAPQAVISFGQGGDDIALERTAYNLQDTGEVPGGVPDNRGIIRAATLIDPSAASTRATLLPLTEIEEALTDAGESPRYSTDPGRYICNNVMFADVGAMSVRGGVAGFIHLPYTTEFDAEVRARFGRVALAAVQATADSLR